MNVKVHEAVISHQEEILAFAQELVRIPSVTGNEKEMAYRVSHKMSALDFENVHIDSTGNVIGYIGNGPKTILFDGHMDTVDVIDPECWKYDPYAAKIVDGRLYGRGSVDMKGALVISIYAAVIAREVGITDHIRICVAASVMEEDFDGVAVQKMLDEEGLLPDYAVFGEATSLQICRGHNGRALIEITVPGKSAHGSKPHLAINPVYKMNPIIDRVESLAKELYHGVNSGSLALTNIYCETASNNSVPQNASLILDRRLSITENDKTIESEMKRILEETDARWTICDIPGKTWTNSEVSLHSYLPAWEIPENCTLIQAAKTACHKVLNKQSQCFKASYCTDAVTTAGKMGIPTIILGPGDNVYAHGQDEFCPVDDLMNCCEIYVHLCNEL